MHFKEINIKSTVCNYYSNNLVKANILETKNISIDQKTIVIWSFILLDIIIGSQQNC